MATREEKNTFSTMILTRAEQLQTDHMDAILTYCEEMELEVEIAASLINDVLMAKLEEEAQQINVIPRSAKLPI